MLAINAHYSSSIIWKEKKFEKIPLGNLSPFWHFVKHVSCVFILLHFLITVDGEEKSKEITFNFISF
jgi:hypothetical protein